MDMLILLAFGLYFAILFLIGYIAYQKSLRSGDFILGGRSLNYWVTALAAHASDMSGWIFMGFPAVIYAHGLIEAWTAIGLTVCMYLNWVFIAPKLRTETERYHSLTLSTYLEARFADRSGILRIVSALFCLVFFTFYISANLVILGRLFDSVFGIPYCVGILLGCLVVFYILLGGFISISWIDFFQGIFLLCMIILVPVIAYQYIGGWGDIISAAQSKNISLSLMPSFSWKSWQSLLAAVSWGLGYFGMPHILTKFMGINDAQKIKRAKIVGISWQILSLTGATCVGLIGMAFFKHGLVNNEYIFIEMVKQLFPSFFAGMILCAILATTINVMGAQVLVSASVLAEDFYKKFFLAHYSDDLMLLQKRIAFVSRVSVIFMCFVAYVIAFYSTGKTIYELVNYAWTGLGCSFGPLIILSLHTKIKNRFTALAGIITGGLVAGLWPLFNKTIPAMLVGFSMSLLVMFIGEYCLAGRKRDIVRM
jgi:sodium/proline symporter